MKCPKNVGILATALWKMPSKVSEHNRENLSPPIETE